MKTAKNEALCRAWAAIDLDAICSNYLKARSRVNPSVKMAAVVKANAYGHGALPVVKALRSLPQAPDFFAVATAGEALEIADETNGIPVLVLGHVLPGDYPDMIAHAVRIPVDSEEEMEAVALCAKNMQTKAFLHVALDTGMTRIGFEPSRESAACLAGMAKNPYVVLEGLFSHLATADMTDDSEAWAQARRYESFVELLKEQNVEIPIRHLANSAGISNGYPAWDMVRLGISLYGLKPSFEVPADNLVCRPAMTFCARVVRVREVPEGVAVSYGGRFVTKRRSVIATVSAGYADGIHRSQREGCVLVRGKKARIAGTICMDQFMIDVTDIPEVRVGDKVTLFGQDGDARLSVDEVARDAGTIGYELVCSVSERVPRIFD